MAETREDRLKKYGATNIKRYSLINNYGYTFEINGARFDIRFWANCYGVARDVWEILPLSKKDDGSYIYMDKELRAKIEDEFNSID